MTHPLPFGHVTLAGAGPGAVGHLTLAVARALETADVVLHDKLVSAEVLALAGPQATVIETGKEGFGPSMPQAQIEAMMVEFALSGRNVLRLKSGDPGLFGRLGEELDALDAAGIAYTVLPGITAAAAAAAGMHQSLTERGRNRDFRLLTGHGAEGFAEADWASLARPGSIAAIYMGKKAARFIQGRLMMHGAAATTPVTLVENASRSTERRLTGTLADLPALAAQLDGPAVILWGLAPRAAQTANILEAAQ
ncbi:uroporphyrinogen-III C-methyltransferase [Rhodobacter sp. TJ_12]|uniref:uroporphyrinogen-III C-methyltransferase n=1 Tax=Rhodobacter sp. TJ_12 TaxID=2029399 RepID=UPI001CBFF680|nr:uroporphyrinogen-III C-methyltransferase [Rhodobacter sp. TJ_12]MBZ4022230.1 uroporphyrinogen-III C-methyltransferase [Rhodobacter sp. TJ_12]